MRWEIETLDDVAVVHMVSNKVNKQNPQFFSDLHEALDELEREHADRSVVLTGLAGVFSAGLDFEYTFPLFQQADIEATEAWFRQIREGLLRVLTYPRPTVAALNGHAFAGGLLLALCCDFRIAGSGEYTCCLNEISLGMPMPSVYTELVRFRVGTQVATEAILAGKRYTQADALSAGFYDRVVDAKHLLERCRESAECVPHGSLPAFAHSKRMLLAPLLERIHAESAELDQSTARAVSDPQLLQRQRLSMDELKHRRRKKG